MAGLLDYFQQDPEKQSALRMGLLNAGAAMLANQTPSFANAAGQGLGAGIQGYQQYGEQQYLNAMKQAQLQNTQFAAQTARMNIESQIAQRKQKMLSDQQDIDQAHATLEKLGIKAPQGSIQINDTGDLYFADPNALQGGFMKVGLNDNPLEPTPVDQSPIGQTDQRLVTSIGTQQPQEQPMQPNPVQARPNPAPVMQANPVGQTPRIPFAAPPMPVQQPNAQAPAIPFSGAQPSLTLATPQQKQQLNQSALQATLGLDQNAMQAFNAQDEKGQAKLIAQSLLNQINGKRANRETARQAFKTPSTMDYVLMRKAGITDPSNMTDAQVNTLYDLEMAAKKAGGINNTFSPTNISGKTESKYGEAFAGKLADSDVKLHDIALTAPDLAVRAKDTLDLLSSNKAITGFGSDWRLKFAKAMHVAGLSDGEDASVTESLASDLANNTLDFVHSSGLGTGNGFTDKDLQFLNLAKGGSIQLEAGTLKRLATLAARASQQSVLKWNRRKATLAPEILQGTGLNKETIDMPAMGEYLRSFVPMNNAPQLPPQKGGPSVSNW